MIEVLDILNFWWGLLLGIYIGFLFYVILLGGLE